jgi:hypothetical protein
VPAAGADALDLVYQAAEIFNSIENAEHSLREVVADADRKLADASRVLTEIELRITAAEDMAAAAETRAQVAETEAREAKQTLALVEDAIRRRLLCASPEAARRLHDVA